MAAEVMKLELETETCCVCGGGGELLTPEEHDAGAHVQVPLRTMLLQLNCNKTMPDGRLCANCIRRAMEAYEFSTALSTKGTPPLSEKIRALRRRLHELTQKIDVFIVVGASGGAGSYSEDDIIMVERDALAAAAAADDEDLERARNARGDSVYQCSVCPLSFQRVSEYRSHLASHPADAQHSCWTCGAQFATRGALASHAAQHCGAALACQLCGGAAHSAAELRRHEAGCPPRCPACGALFPDRAALSAHAQAAHARDAGGVCVCPACFRVCDTPELLSAHLLRHRQAKHYVCGYDACILRFATRNNLVAHIRKCHAGSPPAPEPAAASAAAAGDAAAAAAPHVACSSCDRTFGSVAAMKRHARVHRRADDHPDRMEEGEDMEGEVEYLEVDELDYRFEEKPNLDALL